MPLTVEARYGVRMATGQLTRSTTDRQLGGVSGGLAAHFGVDATLVRVIFVVTTLFGGFGAVVYILLWILLPEGPSSTPAIRVAEERFARGEISKEDLDQIRRDLETG